MVEEMAVVNDDRVSTFLSNNEALAMAVETLAEWKVTFDASDQSILSSIFARSLSRSITRLPSTPRRTIC